MKQALIVFAHGARDPRWAAPFERLREISQAALPETSVRLAFLELMSPRLPEALAGLVQEGCGKVSLVPVFFGQGGHVLRDLPLLVDELRARGSVSLPGFYARRVRRLLPMATLVLVTIAIVGHLVIAPIDQAGLGSDLVAVGAAALICGVRLLALWRGWTAPVPRESRLRQP